MVYPAPSEAFVSVEVNELRRKNIDVTVGTIRSRRRDHDRVIEQQQARHTPVDHADWKSPYHGLLLAFFEPRLAIRLWWKLLTSLATRPVVLASCLFWSLRCFELLALIRREKPDVVHLYWGHVTSMLGWLLIESQPDQALTTGLSAYDLEMAIPFSFEVARRSRGVRTWASINIETIASQGVAIDQIQLVHQGVSIKQFSSDETPRRARGACKLAFVGRLIPAKGVELVVELIRRLSTTFPDLELVVIGDGPLHGILLKIVEEWGLENRIRFLGHISHTALAEELKDATLLLLPSSHTAERLPNVVKEAAAAGCCCLTTGTPGIGALIRDRESGRILPAGDVDAWVTAVAELLNDSNATQVMADVARQRVKEHFDIERTTDQLIAWWERVASLSAHAWRGST